MTRKTRYFRIASKVTRLRRLEVKTNSNFPPFNWTTYVPTQSAKLLCLDLIFSECPIRRWILNTRANA